MPNTIERTSQVDTILTGIKPTGVPHIGNYLGAIAPALRRSEAYEHAYFFIADYHALNSIQSPERMRELSRNVAATWLASGLDPRKIHFYRQSDVPETFELETILNTFVPKGWMNKMHAYKASIDENRRLGKSDDNNVNMGLYTYPILMACDMLIFNANVIPVGQDQVQHVEIARDIAQRFNKHYNTDLLVLPNYVLEDGIEELPGIDGRKMSKSYSNTIPLFATREEWEKSVRQIKTDNEAHTEETLRQTTFYKIFAGIATQSEASQLCQEILASDIGWKIAKERLVDVLEVRFGEASKKYFELMENPAQIESALIEGADAIRPLAQESLLQIKKAIGIR